MKPLLLLLAGHAAGAQEPDAPTRPSRFVIHWKNTEGRWRITKVTSLHW